MGRIACLVILVFSINLMAWEGQPPQGENKIDVKEKGADKAKDKDKTDKDKMGKEKTEKEKEADKNAPTKFEKIKWFDEVEGKDLDYWIKAIKDKDPSIREKAMRNILLFDPKDRPKALDNLFDAITAEKDYSVRMMALATLPGIIFENQSQVDTYLSKLISLLPTNISITTRMEAISALGRIGSPAHSAILPLIEHCLKYPGSWQIRKATATALGMIGLPQKDEEEKGPDQRAINALITALHTDISYAVRREALNALIILGRPVNQKNVVLLQTALQTAVKKDKDKSIPIWGRVALIRLNKERAKPTDVALKELVAYLGTSDDEVKYDAIQAIGTLASEVDFLIPELQSIVESVKESKTIKAAAIASLSRMESKEALVLDYLKQVEAKHIDKEIRTVATNTIKLMKELKDQQAFYKKQMDEMNAKLEQENKTNPKEKNPKDKPKKGSNPNP